MKNFKQWISTRAGLVSMGLAAGVVALPALAQAANVEVGGQLRYRGEYDVRDFNPDTNADFVNTQRSRVNVKYNNGRYHGFLQIQDVRVWGEEANTLTDASADSLDMHQAFLKVDDVLGTGVGVQIGRQEINFADQRLVGAVNWTQNARSLDGIIFSRAFGDQGVVIPFYLQLNEQDRTDAVHGSKVISSTDKNGNLVTGDEGHNEDTYVAGFHSAWKVAEGHSFQPHVYYLHSGVGDNLSLYDIGFYYTGTTDPVSYDFTASYQTGSQGSIDISAYLVSGHLFFTSGPLKVGAGVDYLSGDDDNNPKTDNNSYNTLLATNHKFYGYMDYFLAFGSLAKDGTHNDNVAGLGLIDYQLKGSYAVDKATSVALDVHYFQTAESTDSTGTDVRLGGEDNLGTELDLTAKHKMGPVTVQAGWSAFFKDDAMERKVAPENFDSDPTNDHSVDSVGYWGYVMASLNF